MCLPLALPWASVMHAWDLDLTCGWALLQGRLLPSLGPAAFLNVSDPLSPAPPQRSQKGPLLL